MEKDLKTVLLIDTYSGLLTEKQLRLCDMYYNQDYSLSEIAQIENTTRQAARDGLEKARRKLFSFESVLGLCDKRAKTQYILERVKTADDRKEVKFLIGELADIWEIEHGV